MRISIETKATGRVVAELYEEKCPETVRKISEKLPLEAVARTWGDEIYFEIDVIARGESQISEVKVGDIGYWPPGRAFCIFFGPTPISASSGGIIPASAVNPIGRVIGDPNVFKKVKDGDIVMLKLL